MNFSSSRDDYKFLQIVDARAALNQKVNLIGVVVETGLPKQSKGTDCFCSVRVIDESYPNPGISINFFTETMDKLPQVLTVGDIIQLSQVVMKSRGPDVYALFNKKFSSFAIFDGKNNSNFLPYQWSPKYQAREQDKKFILGLMKWLVDHKIDTGLADLHSLSEIREGERFNLICKIVHLCEVAKDKWMLLVWDGTDTPPITIKTKLEEEMEKPLPLQPVDFTLQRDTLCTLPPLGTVLRVTVDDCNEKLGINFLKSNRWVRLINIRCELHTALWHAVLMPFTRVCYLSDEDNIVLQRMRQYDERRKSKWGWMPLSSFPWPSEITETDYPDVPFVSLMRALANSRVVGKFHCVVRVVAAFPWLAEDFRSPSGVYRIRLTLEDPTARIHAYLYKEDAVIIVSALTIFYQSLSCILQHNVSHLRTIFHDLAQYLDTSPGFGYQYYFFSSMILCIWEGVYDVPILITELLDFVILKQNEDSMCHSCRYCTNNYLLPKSSTN